MANRPKRSRSTRGFVKGAQLGETFRASYRGTCATCRLPWEPGDMIGYQPGGGYGHSVCPKPVENRPTPRPYRVAPMD